MHCRLGFSRLSTGSGSATGELHSLRERSLLSAAKNLVAWRKSLHAIEILRFAQDDNSTNTRDSPGKRHFAVLLHFAASNRLLTVLPDFLPGRLRDRHLVYQVVGKQSEMRFPASAQPILVGMLSHRGTVGRDPANRLPMERDIPSVCVPQELQAGAYGGPCRIVLLAIHRRNRSGNPAAMADRDRICFP